MNIGKQCLSMGNFHELWEYLRMIWELLRAGSPKDLVTLELGHNVQTIEQHLIIIGNRYPCL